MDLDPGTFGDPRKLYGFMTALILPRPIGWVSTISPDGRRNLAPYSFFNGVAASPPTVSLSILHAPAGDHRKDTWRNIQASREFVVNVADEALVEQVNLTGTECPADVDEFDLAGLEAEDSHQVAAPRVAQAPAHLECRLLDTLRVGEGMGGATLVVGEIVHIHVADRVVQDGPRVDLAQLRPVSRLGGASYAPVREVFDLERLHYDPERHGTGRAADAAATDGAGAAR